MKTHLLTIVLALLLAVPAVADSPYFSGLKAKTVERYDEYALVAWQVDYHPTEYSDTSGLLTFGLEDDEGFVLDEDIVFFEGVAVGDTLHVSEQFLVKKQLLDEATTITIKVD